MTERGATPAHSAVDLYLDLLAKTLSFSLWPEPPHPLHLGNEFRPNLRRTAVSAISKALHRFGLDLTKRVSYNQHHRDHGLVFPLYAETMIGAKRLANIRTCAETVLRDDIPGDFIETGAWRGGACIFMRAILKAHGVTTRRVFVADLFEGLPRPDPEKFPVDAGDKHHLNTFLVASLESVQDSFLKYGLLDEQVVFLKGYFSDTLPKAEIDKLALLRLDGDMYGSTMDALANLYAKLQPGGFCIIDDYDLGGAHQAVNDFRASNSIVAPLTSIDQTGVFWRK